jgi:[ribosomal protein S5]-alanine N-acetyltransferase
VQLARRKRLARIHGEHRFAAPTICATLSRMLPESFETARLILRPIAAGDAPAIFTDYARDPRVLRFLTFRPHRALSETEAYIGRCTAAATDRSRTYVLIGRVDGRLLGAFDLRRPEAHRLGFGYVLAHAHWGRGLMTEALGEVVDWAMRQDAIWRIGDVCDTENLASARVMEKAGLEREGILRRWIVRPNISSTPRDCFSYARVRSEF